MDFPHYSSDFPNDSNLMFGSQPFYPYRDRDAPQLRVTIQGKTIDVAGRQRMLTQRMSKEFLQVALALWTKVVNEVRIFLRIFVT